MAILSDAPVYDTVVGDANHWILFQGTPEQVKEWLTNRALEPDTMVYVGKRKNYVQPEAYLYM